jgi:N-acetylated-alpha-linked acidic dipeptidase
LPDRPWFTHQLYAPGVYTGYAAKAIPSVREAIEQRKWDVADEQIRTVAQTLEGLVKEIEKAKNLL